MPVVETKGSASSQGFGEFAKSGGPANYIEDVFSTYLYTGTGSSQTITNNIDTTTYGGLVWIKGRSDATGHRFTDTARGTTKSLASNSTNAEVTESTGLTAFGTTGFTIGADADYNTNTSTYASWTFRKQAKFFDVVTYTGNGVAGRTVAHNLGSVPGSIFVKVTDASGNWNVYHRSLGATKYILLNSTSAELTDSTRWNDTAPTSTEFTLGTAGNVNANGLTYVAYLFAHNAGGFGLTGTDNVISCGSCSTSRVELGWEPQWILIKEGTSTAGTWYIVDNMRGMAITTQNWLYANSSVAESSANYLQIDATGFTPSSFSATNIYIAIRRGPMKTPTSGASVFSPVTYTGSGATQTVTAGFPVDLSINGNRGTATIGQFFFDRLRGATIALNSTDTTAEATDSTSLTSFASNTAITLGTSASGWVNDSSRTYIDWMFQRAPSFMDVVCYTGNGTSGATQSHNLGVVPEMMIVKIRNDVASWLVYHKDVGNTKAMALNSTIAPATNSGYWNNTTPTSSVFTLGSIAGTNGNGYTFVAYLFASCSGVSKVGSYTGSGTTKQIDCGFTGGARFVLIKRTDSTGDWYVWDSARGIVAGNDPYLLLNDTAAEVTNTDYVDTYSAGFEISSTAPAAINANGGTFIFLAIA